MYVSEMAEDIHLFTVTMRETVRELRPGLTEGEMVRGTESAEPAAGRWPGEPFWQTLRMKRMCPCGPSSWEFSSCICGALPRGPSISYLIHYLNLNQRGHLTLGSWL